MSELGLMLYKVFLTFCSVNETLCVTIQMKAVEQFCCMALILFGFCVKKITVFFSTIKFSELSYKEMLISNQ